MSAPSPVDVVLENVRLFNEDRDAWHQALAVFEVHGDQITCANFFLDHEHAAALTKGEQPIGSDHP